MDVRAIKSADCKEWVLKKHYAQRKPRIQYAYGLFINGVMEGIVTYGYPATPFVSRGICGREYEKEVLELNRLVVNEHAPKNAASFLVSHSIKLLPNKIHIIVSYADTSVGHIGYIYQATNFYYTGLTIDMKEWVQKDPKLHSQNVCKKLPLAERADNKNFKQIWRPKKHRYLFFRGSKKEKKIRLAALKYKIEQYPKGITSRYTYDLTNIQKRITSFI